MLLAFDTATPAVTVALAEGARVLAERSADRPMRHGEQLAPLIEAVLADAGATRSDLTEVAVGVGPGPFTGLRVGLVTAHTLGHVLRIAVRGVCTLDVLAAEAVGTAQVTGDFLVATDARRREVYAAPYDADGRRTAEPVVTAPAAASTDLPVVGEGAALYPESFPHPAGPRRPSAGWLARVVADRLAPVVPPQPMYLRRPDAAVPGRPKPVS